ncbi:unnamed protein product [Meloidogyne enterolobii]|uniref:Uncharacterized protein n=2 Tax=Meloidogyne enterolobii TaxID=390850 RepID=A0ACB0Z3Q3_MELEN
MLIRSHFTHDDNAMVNMVNSLPPEAYFLECDGSVHEELGTIQKGKLIQLHFRLCGGKGGFGSLLRSFRIHKSNNQLMCRNLAGRRLADVREEERLKKYIEKKEQREKEKKKKEEEKIDKLKNGAKTKHEFTDQEYLRKRDTVLDVVEDAVEAGVLALQEKQKAAAEVENNDVTTQEELTGPSTSSNIQKASTSSNVNDEQNSDSDESLDDLMSCGPLKKKIPLALRALQEYDGHKQEKKLPLFPDTKKMVYLTVKYKRPFFKKSGNQCVFVTQPYPDRNPSNSSVCLILPDLDRSKKAQTDPDVDKQAREWEERLRENYGLISGVNYTKILTFIQLTREYTEVTDRVKLANLYDMFFVDYKLAKKVDYFMGKLFKRPARRPILIKSEQNFSKRIEEAYNQTLIFFMPMNDAITIRVGNLNQKIKHLKSNVSAIISSLLQDFPGGLINIRSVYLAAVNVSLPVYVDFGSSNEINFELPPEPELVEIVGECSTLPEGLEVKVRADGLVTTVEKKSGEEVLYPTEQDEWEKEDDMKPLNAELIQKILRKGKVQTKMEKIKEELRKMVKGEVKEEEEEKRVEEVKGVVEEENEVVEEGAPNMLPNKKKNKKRKVKNEEEEEKIEEEKEEGEEVEEEPKKEEVVPNKAPKKLKNKKRKLKEEEEEVEEEEKREDEEENEESEEETEEEVVLNKSPTKNKNKKRNGAIKRKIENSSIEMIKGRKTKKAKKNFEGFL